MCGMKIATLLLALIAGTLAAQAQNASIHRWSKTDPASTHIVVNGRYLEYIDAGGFHVAVSLQDTGWKMRADIKITNNSGQPVDIHPEQFKATVEGPKTKELKYNDPDALIRSIRRGAGWRAAFAGALIGGGATTTTTSQTDGTAEVHGPDGTANGTYSGTTTTTVPDHC
jgi:hypothetical protein